MWVLCPGRNLCKNNYKKHQRFIHDGTTISRSSSRTRTTPLSKRLPPKATSERKIQIDQHRASEWHFGRIAEKKYGVKEKALAYEAL